MSGTKHACPRKYVMWGSNYEAMKQIYKIHQFIYVHLFQQLLKAIIFTDYLLQMHNRKPISKDTIDDQFHFLIQWPATFCSCHFSLGLQVMAICWNPQKDICQQPSMAAKAKFPPDIRKSYFRAFKTKNEDTKNLRVSNQSSYLPSRSANITSLFQSPSSQKSPDIF